MLERIGLAGLVTYNIRVYISLVFLCMFLANGGDDIVSSFESYQHVTHTLCLELTGQNGENQRVERYS